MKERRTTAFRLCLLLIAAGMFCFCTVLLINSLVVTGVSDRVIPPEAADVICVVGASGFGKPISEAAHRPERYAALAGDEQGNPITPQAAARVLTAEGLHRRVFVNQAETALAAARDFAKLLDCPVVVGSLKEGEIDPCLL